MYMFTEAQLKKQDYKFTCKKCGHENIVALPSDVDLKEQNKQQESPVGTNQSVTQNEPITNTESAAVKEPIKEPAAQENAEPEKVKMDLDDIFASLETPAASEKQSADIHTEEETIPEIDFADTGKTDAVEEKQTEYTPSKDESKDKLGNEGDVIEGFEEFTMDDIKHEEGEGKAEAEKIGETKEIKEDNTSWLESTKLEEPSAEKAKAETEEAVLPDETAHIQEETIPELLDTKSAKPQNASGISGEDSSLLQEDGVNIPASIPVPKEATVIQKTVTSKKHIPKLLTVSVTAIIVVLAAIIGIYYYLVEYTPAHPDIKKLTFMSYSVLPVSAKAKSRAGQLLGEADKQYLNGTISGYESSLNLYEQAVAADHHLVKAYIGIAKDYTLLKDRNNLQDQLKNSGKFLSRLKVMLNDNAQYNLVETMIAIANNDYKRASNEINAALQKSPDLPEALYYRGYIDFKQGESMTTTTSLLQHALSLEPNMIKAKLLLARIYQEQQEPSNAIEILDDILASYPYNISAVVLKADIHANSVTGTTRAISDLNAILNEAGNKIDTYDRASLYYTIGKMQMRISDYPSAIEEFKNSLQNNKSVRTYIALGDAYLANGNINEAEKQYKTAIATDSTTVEGNFKLAHAYYLDHKYVLSISYYTECLKLEKNNPDVLYGLALAREENGELDTALNTVETAVKLSPDNPKFIALDGRLLRKKEDYKNAAAVLSKAVERFPDYAPLHTEYAVVLGKEGDYNSAIKQLNTAMRIFPVSADNDAYMADMLNMESKYPSAERYALKALSIDNALPYAYEVLGDIYFNEHKLNDSIKAYNSSIAVRPYKANVFYKLAKAYIAGGVFTSAVSCLESAVKINPTNALYHYALGNVYRDMGNIQLAINEYTKAIYIDNTMAEAYYQRGLMNIEGKNDLAAINDLKNAMKYAPNNPDYMIALSNYYYKNKETYSAIDYLKMALKIAPQNPEIHYKLGAAYNYVGKIEDAKKEFLTALNLSPNYSNAMVGLGNIYYQNGDIEKAQQYYEKAIRIAPDNGDAYYALGTVYEYNGMFEKALTEYKYAVKFSKNPATAYFKEGIVLSNLSEPEQAKAALLKAISLGLSSDMENTARNRLRNLM
jgi:tetratricopeptide (TPR) repeat protein